MVSILYVDDEPDLLILGKEFLERSGDFQVNILTSPEDALTSAEINTCDVIVSDYQMAGMDGIAFLKTVRERYGDIPFILFTGRGREEVVIQGINYGVDFYIQKGGDARAQFAELAHKIRQAVARRQAEHSLVESEKRLADIINFLPDATFAIDKEGRVIAWNHAIEEMTGVPAALMLGKNNHAYAVPFYGKRQPLLIDLVFEPDAVLAEHYTHISRDRGIVIGETTRARPKDLPVTLMATAGPLYNRQGEVTGAIESMRNISGIRSAEEALRASEEKYRLVVEHSQDAIYIHRSDRLLFVNEKAAELTGYPHGELMAIRLWDLVHPDDRDLLADRAKKRFAGEDISSVFTARLLTRDGRIRPCEFFVDLIPYQGAPAILGIARDITKQKETEDTLRASEERVLLALEASNDGMFDWDMDSDTAFLSPRYLGMLGYGPGDLPASFQTWKALLHPDDREDALAVIGQYRKGLRATHAIEFRLRTKDGSWKWILSQGKVTSFDEQGIPHRLVGTHTDITGRKHAEEALRESEDKYRHILEHLQDAYFQADLPGKLTMVSPSGAHIYGYDSPDEMVGLPAASLYYDATQRTQVMEMLARDGAVGDFTGLARRKDGSAFWASISLQPITGPEGRVIGTEAIVRDISARRAMEHAVREANKKLNLLNSITRHDVANQLTAMRGYVELAAMKKPDPAVLDFLAKIGQTADTIERQIAFTRAYQELGIHAPVWFDLETVIRKSENAAVPVRFSGTCRSVSILADPMLERVFFNIMDNAIRHGKRVTGIAVRCEREPDGLLVIVEDDGVGIKQHEKEKIFAKGYGKNTGFGLFLAREILAITGIAIRETGVFGNGARFEMYIPRGAYRLPEGKTTHGNRDVNPPAPASASPHISRK